MNWYYVIGGLSAIAIIIKRIVNRQVDKEQKGKGSIDFKSDHRL